MKVVILAAGKGRRVKPLCTTKPKCMFKLLGRPILSYVIENLRSAGFKDLVIVTGFKGEVIKEYFKDGKEFGVKIEYVEQKPPFRGMGEALLAAKDLVEDKFLVVNSNDIYEQSVLDEIKRKLKKDFLLVCREVVETWKYGIVKLDGEKVLRIVEKPPKGKEPSNLAVVGIYLLNEIIFSYLKKLPPSDHQYEDAIQALINDAFEVCALKYDGFFGSFKYPWDLFSLNKFLMDKFIKEQIIEEDVKISEKADVIGNVWIRKGTKILEGAVINGPCFIGKECLIGNNCLIRDYVSIGDACIVGYGTEIKNSIIEENCRFHRNYIGDSIIERNCLFGAGAVTANFRFDEQNIKVIVDEKKIDTGLKKLGVIMGENCKVGVNACIMPGRKVGPNSIIGPGVCLMKNLGEGKSLISY